MHIKKVRARRFLSVGEDWAEVDFTNLGRIINIRGTNLDYGKDASNGAGKSTVIEMVVWGMFGKLQKGLNHKNVNHIYSKKGAEVELWVDNLKIVRTGKPHGLTIYEDDAQLKLGGVPSTQEELNKRLKLNYDGFVNVSCFGQHSFHGFLEGDAAHKRSVAENLLRFDHYARYHEVAKKQRTYLLDTLRELEIRYDAAMENMRRSNSKIMTHRSQQAQWQKGRMGEVSAMEVRLGEIAKELAKPPAPDAGDLAQIELGRITALMADRQSQKKKYLAAVQEADAKCEAIRSDHDQSQMRLVRTEAQLREAQNLHRRRHREIEELEETKGKQCPKCLGVVKEENVKRLTENYRREFLAAGQEVELLRVRLGVEQEQASQIGARYAKVNDLRTTCKKKENELAHEINALSLERTQWLNLRPANEREIALSKEKEMVEQRMAQARAELSSNDPFVPLIQGAEDEMRETQRHADDLKKDIDQKKKLLPYYEYWVKGYGDRGIRSFLLEERLPMLNKRINFWLQILIDNRLKLFFDRDLSETIRRVPDDTKKFVYNSLSGGELMRIDLSISQAFAYVTMATSQSCPSLIALDEIGNHFDRPGKQAVYRMICELAKDRQVLVITHDADLLDMLKTCDTIHAVMTNGVTSVEILKGGLA